MFLVPPPPTDTATASLVAEAPNTPLSYWSAAIYAFSAALFAVEVPPFGTDHRGGPASASPPSTQSRVTVVVRTSASWQCRLEWCSSLATLTTGLRAVDRTAAGAAADASTLAPVTVDDVAAGARVGFPLAAAPTSVRRRLLVVLHTTGWADADGSAPALAALAASLQACVEAVHITGVGVVPAVRVGLQ